MLNVIKILNLLTLGFVLAFLFGFACHSMPTFRPLLYLSVIIVIAVCAMFAIGDAGKVNGYYRGSVYSGWIFKTFLVLLVWLFTVGIGWWLYLSNPVEEARLDALRQQQREQQKEAAEAAKEAVENAP